MRPCGPLQGHVHGYWGLAHTGSNIHSNAWLEQAIVCYICTTHTHSVKYAQAPSVPLLFHPHATSNAYSHIGEALCARGHNNCDSSCMVTFLTRDSMGNWAHSAVRTPVGPVTSPKQWLNDDWMTAERHPQWSVRNVVNACKWKSAPAHMTGTSKPQMHKHTHNATIKDTHGHTQLDHCHDLCCTKEFVQNVDKI